MQDQGQLFGKYPGVVIDYDQVTRTCRVQIPGISDGGDSHLIAEIMYPLGDKPRIIDGQHHTEIEMLPGDHVWLEFIGGDQRYPLIVGYRSPNSGNSLGWRRWHHANIEITADGVLRLNANAIEFNAATTITTTADTATINAKTQVNGSQLKHNSKNVGDTHQHSDPQGGNTGVPI